MALNKWPKSVKKGKKRPPKALKQAEKYLGTENALGVQKICYK